MYGWLHSNTLSHPTYYIYKGREAHSAADVDILLDAAWHTTCIGHGLFDLDFFFFRYPWLKYLSW